MLWSKCDKLLTNAQGKVINCDFCPCPVYAVIAIVERPLDQNWQIIPCQSGYQWHTIAHIVDGHFCLQYRPQKQIEIAVKKPKKDEVIFEDNVEQWSGHNRNNIKLYFLSDCYQDYNEFMLMYNSQSPQYWDSLAHGKRLAWSVSCGFYGIGYNIDTPYCIWDEQTFDQSCGFFLFSDGETQTQFPYPNGQLWCDDPGQCNPLFEAAFAEMGELVSALEESDREEWPLITSDYTEDFCHTFSHNFGGGCWTGGGHPSFFWDNAGFAYFTFEKPADVFNNAIGVRFKINNSQYVAYFGQEFKKKDECWGVEFGFDDMVILQDEYGNDYIGQFWKDGTLSFPLQLIDYVY